MKKRLSLILLIALVSCSNNYQELTNDNKQYYNYQLNYYVGNINETFEVDLLSYYKDNYIVDANKNIYKLDEEYSTCVIGYRNSENNTALKYKKKISNFKYRLEYLYNQSIYCYLVNETKNVRSEIFTIAYAYVKDEKNAKYINTVEDLYAIKKYGTYILNNDLDLTNYNPYRIERDNQLAARFKCSTFLNPNNHKIKNLKQAESRTFIFETLEDCYMENFIFEDIIITANEINTASVIYEAVGCIFINNRIKNFNVTTNNSENNYSSIIAPFVINSYGSGYINNKVFATIRQSGTPSEMDIYPYVAAGLVGKMTIGELYSFPVCYNAIEGLIYTSGIEVGIIGLTYNSSNIFDNFNKMDIMTNKKTKFIGKEIDQNLFFSIL